MSINFIEISHLSYLLPDGHILFNNLSFGLGTQKIGFVGRNGLGKTTLVRLIVGDLEKQSGNIEIRGKIGYVPQKLDHYNHQTLADILEVKNKLDALHRVLEAKELPGDLELIDDDWDLPSRIERTLVELGLEKIALSRSVSSLSGGERMQLIIAREVLKTPDYMIMDEPTNNLDIHARERLYSWISNFKGGLLIISHDRSLLRLMDQTLELTSLGVNFYGGNYDVYLAEKEAQEAAAWEDYEDAVKEAKKTEKQVKSEIHEKALDSIAGKKRAIRRGMSKIERKSKQGKAEKSDGRLKIRHERLLDEAKKRKDEAFEKIELIEELRIDLEHTRFPNGKRVLEIENMSFAYSNGPTLFQNFNMSITGPQRVALIGKNGAGKTTLVKLILGQLKPTEGIVNVHIDPSRIIYLDQKTDFLEPNLSVLENFQRFNPHLNDTQTRHTLAKYLFRHNTVHKKISSLSGGERLRAALACCLSSKHPPELLILDEPTNNLDLQSLTTIESALANFKAPIIIISHDKNFIHTLNINYFVHV